MSETRFSELNGKDVLTQDGRECGQVEDVVFDSGTWSIGALVVKLERDLLEEFSMKKPMFGSQTIRLKTSYVSGIGDKVILHKALAELISIYRASPEPTDEAE